MIIKPHIPGAPGKPPDDSNSIRIIGPLPRAPPPMMRIIV